MVSRTPANGNHSGNRSTAGTRDVFRVLFRHKRKMLVFFVTTMSVAVLGLIFWPRSYMSEARLFVRLGRESVGLEPTASLSQTVNIEAERENEINSEVEILRSRVLLEDVVERLGADYVLSPGEGKEGKSSVLETLTVPLRMASVWMYGEISPEERAVTKLESDITVSSAKKSSVVMVNARGREPKRAQRILDTFLSAYLVRHAKANHSEGSHDFFVDQTDLIEEQLTKANHELRDAKNQNGMASVEGQRANVQAQANTIEVAILENERALTSAEAKMTALKKTLSELPEHLMAEQLELPNSAADAMRNQLYKVQIQEKEVSSRYTALHPHVIALRRQVDETRKILDSEEGRRSHSTRKLSVVHQTMQTELATTQAMAAAHKAEAQSLKQQFEAVQSKIRALNDNEVRITDLSRRSELLEASYRTYAENREQTRIAGALETGRISNVKVVQPAAFIAKPSSPRTLLTLLAGLIFATAGAVLLAFAAEYFDRSLKTSDQIEQELGLPVLFSVPRGARYDLIHN